MEPATGFTAANLRVEDFLAAATLNVGDVVFLSAANTVNKSVTNADYARIVGVVVGGRLTYGKVLDADVDISTPAANATDYVLVAVDGVVNVLSDAAIGAVGLVGPGTVTAGRAKVAATGSFILGLALNTTAGAAEIVRVLLQVGRTNLASA